MAEAIFRSPVIDMHSGGTDLKFPHHDNEIAQAEAHSDQDEWVKYWLHSGHLNIKGMKMSKSLKNFTSIKDFMTEYNYREMRFLFLLNQWDRVMNYNPDTSLDEARAKDKQFTNFFRTAKGIVRNFDMKTHQQKWNEKDYELNNFYRKQKSLIHHYMCDNFNTPSIIQEASNLVSAVSIYMGVDNTEIKSPIVKEIANYVSFIMNTLGFTRGDDFAYETTDGDSDPITPLMDLLKNFRNEIRGAAAAKEVDRKKIFKLADDLRDTHLLDIGILLKDQGPTESIWSKVSKDEIEKMAKLAAEEEAKKAEAAAEKIRKDAEEEEKKSTPVSEYFRKYLSENYSQFGEDGLPTHDNEGKELEKSALKKINKIVKT